MKDAPEVKHSIATLEAEKIWTAEDECIVGSITATNKTEEDIEVTIWFDYEGDEKKDINLLACFPARRNNKLALTGTWIFRKGGTVHVQAKGAVEVAINDKLWALCYVKELS